MDQVDWPIEINVCPKRTATGTDSRLQYSIDGRQLQLVGRLGRIHADLNSTDDQAWQRAGLAADNRQVTGKMCHPIVQHHVKRKRRSSLSRTSCSWRLFQLRWRRRWLAEPRATPSSNQRRWVSACAGARRLIGGTFPGRNCSWGSCAPCPCSRRCSRG